MKKIAFISFVAALGGILFGYDTAVISGTIAAVGCAAAEIWGQTTWRVDVYC